MSSEVGALTPLRSLLFVPGTQPAKIAKALLSPADAVILDLEDSVALSQKPAARAAVREFASERPGQGPRRIARVNGVATSEFISDVEAAVGPGLDAVMLPKAESAAQVVACELQVAHHEQERGLAAGGIAIVPLIETVRGLAVLTEIAAATSRVRLVAFGAGDFSLDAGITWDRGNPLLLHARMQLVIASRLADLEPPIDTVYPLLQDSDGLAAEAAEGRRIGFQGKLAIHPQQLGTVNSAFTPTDEQVSFARRVCNEFARALEAGSSAIVVDGVFVDQPIAHRARRLLETAGQTA